MALNFTMITDTCAKVRLAKDAAASVAAAPFSTATGSVVTRNGNVLLPTGAGWYWLSAFGAGAKAQESLAKDLTVLDSFTSKP
jgi:hypothetical protein